MLDQATYPAIIAAHIEQARKEHPAWDRRRAMYQCRNWDDPTSSGTEADSDLKTESGALYAYVDTMIASIVPPNPQVTCRPRRVALTENAKYRQALVNDAMERANANVVLWKLATHASVYPHGVLKAVWSGKKGRPDFLVIDPRNFFFDMEAARWEDVRYAIEVTVLTEAEFWARVPNKIRNRDPKRIYDGNIAKKVQFGSYPTWLKDPKTGRAELNDKARQVFKWCVVFEVHDFTVPGGRYFHFTEGVKEPLFMGDSPYVFVPNPFHILTFNDNLEDASGLSDSEIVENPVRRRDELLTLELRHAQSTIPVTVVNEEVLDDPDGFEDQLSKATSPGDVVRGKFKNGANLKDALGQTPTSALSPSFSSIDQKLDNEVMFRLGMPQYTRGVAGQSDIATELALVDAALRTRQGRRGGLVNNTIVFMAKAIVGLYEEFMDAEDMLPVRLGKGQYMDVARQHLAARDPSQADEVLRQGGVVEEPLDIDYEVIPYSPVENSKSAQLAKLEKYMEYLRDPASGVNRQWLTKKLLDLLDLGAEDEAIVQAPPPPAPPPGGPAVSPLSGPPGGAAGLPGAGAATMQTLKGGNLPNTVPAPPGAPTDARPGMAGGAGTNGAM